MSTKNQAKSKTAAKAEKPTEPKAEQASSGAEQPKGEAKPEEENGVVDNNVNLDQVQPVADISPEGFVGEQKAPEQKDYKDLTGAEQVQLAASGYDNPVKEGEIKVFDAGSKETEVRKLEDMPGSDEKTVAKPYDKKSDEEKLVDIYDNADIKQQLPSNAGVNIEENPTVHTEIQKEADVK